MLGRCFVLRNIQQRCSTYDVQSFIARIFLSGKPVDSNEP